MIITRKWAMPNKATFTIHPIKALLDKYVPNPAMGWADPFSGTSKRCEHLNDINPERQGGTQEAMQFIYRFKKDSLNGVLLDPPYSLNQLKTLYNEFVGSKGLFCVRPDSMIYWSKFKDKVADIIKPDGICISFGWNSMGLGENRGFEKLEILLVPHGGSRNDTIVTVERKIKMRVAIISKKSHI